MTILITGGAGFIGSHMAGFLLQKKIDFIILDNLSRSNLNNLNRLEVKFKRKIVFINLDLRNRDELDNFFSNHKIESVIHFAALKSVEESFSKADLYHENNVIGSKNLIELVKEFKIKNFIFSSSCCVYGYPKYLPVDENHSINPINPYGQSKVDIENLLIKDEFFSNFCNTTILRYFNPIGAFDDGLIGENAPHPPSNLMPSILGVACKKFPYLNIYGDDYHTEDGSAVRDFIHIMDLIEAHYMALEHNNHNIQIFNVGTGKGFSVFQILHTFQSINQVEIPFQIKSRRIGDADLIYANSDKIKNTLGWSPKRSLEDMCKDSYLYLVGDN